MAAFCHSTTMQCFVFTCLIPSTLNPFDIKLVLALYRIPVEVCFPRSDGEGHPLQAAVCAWEQGELQGDTWRPGQLCPGWEVTERAHQSSHSVGNTARSQQEKWEFCCWLSWKWGLQQHIPVIPWVEKDMKGSNKALISGFFLNKAFNFLKFSRIFFMFGQNIHPSSKSSRTNGW